MVMEQMKTKWPEKGETAMHGEVRLTQYAKTSG